MIKLIWAMDESKLIGKDNKLPWNLKEDLKHFYDTINGHDLLMGRKTYEFIPKKRISSNKIFVLTRNKDESFNNHHNNVYYINNLDDFILKYKNNKNNILFVCGGSNVYQQTIKYANELIISKVKGKYNGNVYFPIFDINKFELIKKVEYINFSIEYYRKKNSKE